MNRVDTASPVAVAQWKKYLVTEGGLRADNRGGNVPVFFVDSKRGRGVHEVCLAVDSPDVAVVVVVVVLLMLSFLTLSRYVVQNIRGGPWPQNRAQAWHTQCR